MHQDEKQVHPMFPRKVTYGGWEKDDRSILDMFRQIRAQRVMTNEEIDKAMSVIIDRTTALRAEDV